MCQNLGYQHILILVFNVLTKALILGQKFYMAHLRENHDEYASQKPLIFDVDISLSFASVLLNHCEQHLGKEFAFGV